MGILNSVFLNPAGTSNDTGATAPALTDSTTVSTWKTVRKPSVLTCGLAGSLSSFPEPSERAFERLGRQVNQTRRGLASGLPQ
jgi:hypothetical protein